MDEVKVIQKIMSDIKNEFYLIIGDEKEAEVFENLFEINEEACVQAYMTTYKADLQSTLDCLKEQDMDTTQYEEMLSPEKEDKRIEEAIMFLESMEYNIEEVCPIPFGKLDLIGIAEVKKLLQEMKK